MCQLTFPTITLPDHFHCHILKCFEKFLWNRLGSRNIEDAYFESPTTVFVSIEKNNGHYFSTVRSLDRNWYWRNGNGSRKRGRCSIKSQLINQLFMPYLALCSSNSNKEFSTGKSICETRLFQRSTLFSPAVFLVRSNFSTKRAKSRGTECITNWSLQRFVSYENNIVLSKCCYFKRDQQINIWQ